MIKTNILGSLFQDTEVDLARDRYASRMFFSGSSSRVQLRDAGAMASQWLQWPQDKLEALAVQSDTWAAAAISSQTRIRVNNSCVDGTSHPPEPCCVAPTVAPLHSPGAELVFECVREIKRRLI